MSAVSEKQSIPVEVRGRFHRSIQLNRDYQERSDLSGYLLTPTVQELTSRLLSEVPLKNGVRAWSITGPYGTGKSSFALFLSKLLTHELTNNKEAETLRKKELKKYAPFLPILIGGQRTSLKHSLLNALAESLKPIDKSLAKNITTALSEEVSDEAVVSFFEDATAAANKKELGGILLIIDEFGKFLEYIAANIETEDLLLMQMLAESAARSTVPFIFVTILHTGFSAYLNSSDEVKQAEWQKVQGRFTDVAFQEPPEQLLKLVGTALNTNFSPALSKKYKTQLKKVIGSPALVETNKRLPLDKLLIDCLPLDPIAALLLWPLFRSKLAQNERSLFSFLTSQEPFGFQDFLASQNWQSNNAYLFRLDALYDYVSTSLGPGTFQGDLSRRWVEVDSALERISNDAPEQTHSVVKAIGLLWMYGAPVGIRATAEILKLAFDDDKTVIEALDYLERKSIIVYRKFEDAYGLWEGSDVNLSDAYSEALEKISGGNLAKRLSRITTLNPMVARAHYIRTGTLRYFTVQVIDGSEATLNEYLEETSFEGDGRITYVLSRDDKERKKLISLAKKITTTEDNLQKLEIIAFPNAMTGLESGIENVESWRYVAANTPSLQGDLVARKELDVNLNHAISELEAISGNVLGLRGHRFTPEKTQWIYSGKLIKQKDARTFLTWLSELCDETFHLAPTLKNELLNRTKLSTSAKAGLNRLIKGIVFGEHSYRFGIEGAPPEVSMYEAFLRAGGFHTEENNWRISAPNNPEWQPLWKTVENFLSSTEKGRRPVTELYDILVEPPFGLRRGSLPLILYIALQSKSDEIAVYRDGLFQAILSEEVIDLLTHVPEKFEIQQFLFDKKGRQTLKAIEKVIGDLGLKIRGTSESPLLRIAEPLIVSIYRLPDYTKKTRRLDSNEATIIRDALLNAKDPNELLLNEIPSLLGVSDKQQELAKKLKSCLVDLYQAYPRLLDKIEEQVRNVFDLGTITSEEIKLLLQKRATPLKGYASDPTLSLFINEASRFAKDDWREVVGRVIVNGKPTSVWVDADSVAFQMNLQQLKSDFVRLEELVAEKGTTGASKIIRVGVLEAGLREARESISITEKSHTEVAQLTQDIEAVLANYKGKDSRQVKLAALANTILERLEETSE